MKLTMITVVNSYRNSVGCSKSVTQKNNSNKYLLWWLGKFLKHQALLSDTMVLNKKITASMYQRVKSQFSSILSTNHHPSLSHILACKSSQVYQFGLKQPEGKLVQFQKSQHSVRLTSGNSLNYIISSKKESQNSFWSINLMWAACQVGLTADPSSPRDNGHHLEQAYKSLCMHIAVGSALPH